MDDVIAGRMATRDRIVEVAATLLRDQGRAAVTTRAVAERAGVQAPTIYRLFGDKDGLLDAVAEHAMSAFTLSKAAAVRTAATRDTDPVEDLRSGWRATIDFGLANPDLFVLINDPTRGRHSPAAMAGVQLLTDRVHRVALAGRLRISAQHAVQLIHAAGTGAVLTILARPVAERDPQLAEMMLDAVLTQLLTRPDESVAASTGDVVSTAVALRARADQVESLSAGEQTLLVEWLDRIVDGGTTPPRAPRG